MRNYRAGLAKWQTADPMGYPDGWNRLAQHTRGNVSESYKYDHFGRLVEKRENGLTTTFTYDAWGNRLSRVTKNRAGAVVSKEIRSYDRLGRLASTTAGFGSQVTYAYDGRGRLVRQTIDGAPIEYEYTKYGQLAGKYLGGKANPDASVTYEYSKSGQIVARTANGVRQTYAYDRKGQLLAVKDDAGNAVESYAYDKAGNMLTKTVGGKTTTFTFDSANQLVSSTTDGVTTRYAYDAAGRMVREGSKTYRYGYLDKVMSVTDGDTTRTFTYHADGQLASATVGGGHRTPRPALQTETFLWDGLALIQRGDEQFIDEPHIGGGNPVASSNGTTYFNDALGTTVGSKKEGQYSAAALTAFGESFEDIGDEATSNFKHQTSNSATFFTGKPYVEGLGRAFWMRNYRAGLAKWQNADPMGYPDGWNALAYCGNGVTDAVDLWGCKEVTMSIRYSESQKFDAPVVVIWYNKEYDTMAIFSSVAEEAAKSGMTLKKYMEDKFASWLVGKGKETATDIVFKRVLDLLLKAYAQINYEPYYDSSPNDTVRLDNVLKPYLDAGWIVQKMSHRGITIDKDQKIPSGVLSTVIYEVNHHWEIILKKEVE